MMENLSVPANDRLNAVPLADPTQRIVAAVNAQESHWFLQGAAARAEKEFEFSFVDLAARGWSNTVDEIRELNPEVLLTCWSTPFLPEKWLESKECRVRYICHLTGSVRHVVSRRFIERGGLVSNWGSIPAAAVAEHALLLALAALRNLRGWPEIFDRPVLASGRAEYLQVRTLFGRRVGIHGFGEVARALVRLLAPFGVSISAYSPGVPAELFERAGVRRLGNLGELFERSDVIFECEALTPATQNSVGARELALLPDHAVLVNIARAGLIDDDALLREAKKSRIRVALDVFCEEPLPLNSPWRQIPDVVLSPHIAGPTFDQYASCTYAALANVRRYLRGQPVQFAVSTDVYDRST